MSEIRVVADAAGLYRAAAAEFVSAASVAVDEREVFHVALSGGSTPKGMFNLLVTDAALRDKMPWDKTHFWWSDERDVPPEDAESNFKMANEALLTKANIPAEQIHRVRAEIKDAAGAASEYEKEIRDVFQVVAPRIPTFDMILLGMGPDGHTASLFPGTKALDERARLVMANWVGKFFAWRITFTAPFINSARRVVFLVGGDDKAIALKGVLEGPHEPAQLPAQLIAPSNGNLLWLVDERAAVVLKKG